MKSNLKFDVALTSFRFCLFLILFLLLKRKTGRTFDVWSGGLVVLRLASTRCCSSPRFFLLIIFMISVNVLKQNMPVRCRTLFKEERSIHTVLCLSLTNK